MQFVRRRKVPELGLEIAFLKSPGSDFLLELIRRQGQTSFTQPPYDERVFDHLSFEVRGLDEKIERMRSQGVVIRGERLDRPDGTRIRFVEDPEGVVLELIERGTS